MTLKTRSQDTRPNLLLGMEKHIFWQRWLFVVGLILADAGLYIAFLNNTIYFTWFDNLINPIFWESMNIPTGVAEFQGLIYGVLGATLAAWGTLLAFVAHYAFKQKEKWAWNCILVGTLIWYLADTSISLRFGVYVNAVANTMFLILLMLPLAFTRKDF